MRAIEGGVCREGPGVVVVGGGGVPVVGQSGCDPGAARPAVTGHVRPNGSQWDVHVRPVRCHGGRGRGAAGAGDRW